LINVPEEKNNELCVRGVSGAELSQNERQLADADGILIVEIFRRAMRQVERRLTSAADSAPNGHGIVRDGADPRRRQLSNLI
jgi:hypothetical protein